MAAVLLRRLLSNLEEFTTSIPDEVQQLCKVQLLQGVQVEQNANMRKKFCDAIAELAKCYISKFDIQFFHWIFHCLCCVGKVTDCTK